MTLMLRPFEEEDEDQALAAHAALKPEHFSFLIFFDESTSWPHYVKGLRAQRRGLDLSVGQVPGTLLCAVVDEVIVGRVSIRFRLNKYLADFSGHIGYAVLPDHRRRGYATEMLRQALIVARAEGLNKMLIVCDDENVASARVIESNGGVFERLAPSRDGTHQIRRYWIS